MLTVFRDLLVNISASVVANLSSPAGVIEYVVLGIGLIIYWLVGWHRKRVSERKRGMDSWSVIGLCLVVVVLAASAASYGLGLRALQVRAKPDPTVSAELEKTKLELANAKSQLEAAKQPEQPSMPAAYDPYPSGPVIQRKYTPNQARNLIDALTDLTEAATAAQHITVPNELLFLSSDRTSWDRKIAADGFEATISTLTAFKTQLAGVSMSLERAIAKYPSDYSTDLHRILGTTGLQPLSDALDQYILRLNVLSDNHVKPDSELAAMTLSEMVVRCKNVFPDFWRWNQTFVQQRAPEARAALEAYL